MLPEQSPGSSAPETTTGEIEVVPRKQNAFVLRDGCVYLFKPMLSLRGSDHMRRTAAAVQVRPSRNDSYQQSLLIDESMEE